ncbi:MAG TPA: hypothetical protein VEH76_00375 [Methylocystis sp.]|nr:hypothetical protein [Methylocystis sp.]
MFYSGLAQKCGSARDAGADVFMLPLFDDYSIEISVLNTLALPLGKSLLGKRPHHALACIYQI